MSKGKGKQKAAAIDPLPVGFIQEEFLSSSSASTFCRGVVTNAIGSAIDIIQHKHNEQVALDQLPSQFIQQLLTVLEWTNQFVDPVESGTDPGHNWDAEPEPSRCSIDRWARGAIPVKARPRRPGQAPEEPHTTLGPHTLAPSRSNARSIRSVRSRRSANNDPVAEPTIPEENMPRPKPFQPRLRPETADRKHEKLRKREVQKIEQARKDKLALKRQQEADAQPEEGGDTPARHKNVTYDHTGKAIPVEAIKASTLPAYRSSPRVKLPTARGELGGTNTTARKKKSKLARSTTKDMMDMLSTQQKASIAPQLPADDIEPSLGVTLRNSKGQVKSNQRGGQAKAMSRTQYNTMVDSMSPDKPTKKPAGPPPATNEPRAATTVGNKKVPSRKPRRPSAEQKHNTLSLSKPTPPSAPPDQSKSPRFKQRKPANARPSKPKMLQHAEVKEQAHRRQGKTVLHTESLTRSLGGTMKSSYLYQPPHRNRAFSPLHKPKVEVSEKAAQYI